MSRRCAGRAATTCGREREATCVGSDLPGPKGWPGAPTYPWADVAAAYDAMCANSEDVIETADVRAHLAARRKA